MTKTPKRAERIRAKAEIEELSHSFYEGTALSWLWAFLFGPVYFLAHGFLRLAILIFILDLFIIGFFISPFVAGPAWRAKARTRARNFVLIDRARHH